MAVRAAGEELVTRAATLNGPGRRYSPPPSATRAIRRQSVESACHGERVRAQAGKRKSPLPGSPQTSRGSMRGRVIPKPAVTTSARRRRRLDGKVDAIEGGEEAAVRGALVDISGHQGFGPPPLQELLPRAEEVGDGPPGVRPPRLVPAQVDAEEVHDVRLRPRPERCLVVWVRLLHLLRPRVRVRAAVEERLRVAVDDVGCRHYLIHPEALRRPNSGLERAGAL
jgi:hypothetical protein